MEEIKKLKMMLEGKVPIDMTSINSGNNNYNIQGSSEKIIYRDI